MAQDAEATIARCLASATAIVSSILVVDSFSTDNTVDIALKEGAQVLQRPFSNYSDQRNWASEHVDEDAAWILHLDSDEYLTPELSAELVIRVQQARQETAAFMMRRQMVFFGRTMRFGGIATTWHLRLYRRGMGWCEDRRYDQHFVTSGRAESLKGCFVDDNVASLERWTDRHNRWSTAEALEAINPSPPGRRIQPSVFGSPITRKRWLKDRVWSRLPLLWRPFAYFVYRYFLRLGFLDGREGLIFHVLQGFWFRFLVDSKLFEQRQSSRQATRQPKDVS